MASKAQHSKPLANFQSLGNGILYYEPGTPQVTVPSNSPSLIILATWFRALPHQISKYTTTYLSFYPAASILILPNSIPDVVYRPYAIQQLNLQICIPIVQKHIQTPNHEILLHIFSNSGAHTACQLARAYRSHAGTGLPLGGMVLDSAPARGSYRTMGRGFVGGFPSTIILKQLLSLVMFALLGSLVLKKAITGEDNFIEKFRQDLNSEDILRSKRGRVYIYSREDQIVDWEDVESHAKDAERKIGAKEEVRLERWEGSNHVAHRGKDPERYWAVVKKLWEDGEETETPIKSRL